MESMSEKVKENINFHFSSSAIIHVIMWRKNYQPRNECRIPLPLQLCIGQVSNGFLRSQCGQGRDHYWGPHSWIFSSSFGGSLSHCCDKGTRVDEVGKGSDWVEVMYVSLSRMSYGRQQYEWFHLSEIWLSSMIGEFLLKCHREIMSFVNNYHDQFLSIFPTHIFWQRCRWR